MTALFQDMAQALRFAFHLQQHPGDGHSYGAVRLALNDAGVVLAAPVEARALRAQARALLLALQGNLLPAERAALTARYSRDWNARRPAVEQLQDYLARPLRGQVANRQLADKLVTRHYIARRQRGYGWSLPALSDQFAVSIQRLDRAARLIAEYADALERGALARLAEIVLRPQAQEAAHAAA